MDTNLLIAVAIIVLLAVIGSVLLARRRRSDHLAQRFGPEYDRTVDRMGSRSQAERLRGRQLRHPIAVLLETLKVPG